MDKNWGRLGTAQATTPETALGKDARDFGRDRGAGARLSRPAEHEGTGTAQFGIGSKIGQSKAALPNLLFNKGWLINDT